MTRDGAEKRRVGEREQATRTGDEVERRRVLQLEEAR